MGVRIFLGADPQVEDLLRRASAGEVDLEPADTEALEQVQQTSERPYVYVCLSRSNVRGHR